MEPTRPTKWWRHAVPMVGIGVFVGVLIAAGTESVAHLPLGPRGTPYGNGALIVPFIGLPLAPAAGEGYCLWKRAWLAASPWPFALAVGYLLGVFMAFM